MAKRIGILGGGQLALMMAEAGKAYGMDVVTLDPMADACSQSAARLIVGDYHLPGALDQLAEGVDLISYDFENVPVEAARHLERQLPVRPGPQALEAAQDRWVEKQLLNDLGIQTPDFFKVDSRTDLLEAISKTGYPAVLKTRRLGYDGKGQALLRQPEDLERAWQLLGDWPLILEAFVPYDAECSIIAARSLNGDVVFWPLSRNEHDNAILAFSLAPTFSEDLETRAQALVRRLLESLDYVGVVTLELFLVGDELLANEIAPRVHNSGHWTIEGSETSQFANHMLAIAGEPLGDTSSRGASLMINWIGSIPAAAHNPENGTLHDYGKAPREGRKLGHSTLTGATLDEVIARGLRVVEELAPERLPVLKRLLNTLE